MFEEFYHGKRILITGHTGFKGSWLAAWLLRLGARVAGYSLDLPSDPSHFSVLKLRDRLHHYQGDVRNLAELKHVFEVFQPEIVFHLAAQPIVTVSYRNPVETFSTNLMGTINVLECIRQIPSVKTAVMVTSDKCYENVEWAYGYRESDRLGGGDPYSASKACAEIAISSYIRSFLGHERVSICSARAGNVIGGGDWAKDRVIPDAVRAWASGRSCAIRNPSSTRPWQHVLEPLSGYLWLGAVLGQRKARISGEAFNFGPSADLNKTVAELLEAIAEHWSSEIRTHVASDSVSKATKESGLLKLNCDKALFYLGWKPTLRFSESARLTGQWYSAFYAANGSEGLTDHQIAEYECLAIERGQVFCS